MEKSTSEGRRRRTRIALPVAAAAVAAVAAVVFTRVAGAAPAVPEPTLTPPGYTTLASGELERRVAGALGAAPSPSPSARSTATGSSAPWLAQLWYHDDRGTPAKTDDVSFFCAGTVVAPTKILTAAHCVKGYNWYAYGAVVTGTTDLPTSGTRGANLHGGTASLPLRQFYDPAYNPDTSDNDIAVLTLDAPVRATPIRLTTSTDTAAYAPGTAARTFGWGHTRAATLPIRPDADCARQQDFVPGHMVCTGGTARPEPGAPLVVGDRVVGVAAADGRFLEVRHYLGPVRARIDDSNFSRDHRADVFVRRSEDDLGYFKASKGSTLDNRDEVGNWGAAELVLQTDLDRDGFQDLLWRRADDGAVFLAHYAPSAKTWRTTKLPGDWASRTRLVAPGDVTGDDLPDLLSVDSAGVLWIHPGNGDGTFAAQVKVGPGWNRYDAVVGHGDFSGDGKPDLVTRSEDGHHLYLHPGTGAAGPDAFAPRIKVRTWPDYDLLDAVGDVNGDSRADLLARDHDGTLWLYKGTGKASPEIFATRVPAAPDFDQYDLLG
ncbi:hypothetical protein RKD23_002499 [Streptomyces sp. SAI-170]|uniref:trypsin-like serine protease n=1 Tax=Streptomyces sp. SAI-170 TaxID=3377729 RepID=UPI003C7B8F73